MASPFDGQINAFRITADRYPPFDVGGAYKWGSRWCNPGRYVIHATSSYALAVLENLVHFNLGEIPPRQVYVEIRIPARVSREIVRPRDIRGWDLPYPNGVSEAFGDAWYDSKRSAVLIVPSMLSPFESNILVNQSHRDTSYIKVSKPSPVILDHRISRLVKP